MLKVIRDYLIKKIPVLYYLDGLKNYKTIKSYTKKSLTKQVKAVFSSSDSIGFDIKYEKDYIHTMRQFLWAEPNHREVVTAFLEAKISIIKESFSKESVKEDEVILICVIKNDKKRIADFLTHYRALGIMKFVFIDNMSTDGTREILEAQEDVNVYVAEIPYTTNNREGWINRICAYYGQNRWYLCVDSDELFVYIGCESKPIQDFIKAVALKKMKRVRALMLDMYSSRDLFSVPWKKKESMGDYKYFDREGYISVSSYRLDLIHGGSRTRVFSRYNKRFNCTLTKYPLFFYTKGDFQGCSHYQFPYYHNCNTICCSALLHYKFMAADMEKYKERVLTGNYSNGSLEYKTYLEAINNKEKVNFMSEVTTQYLGSVSLQRLNLIEKIF